MMMLWMGSAVLFATCVAVAAFGVERVLRAAGRPTRLLWTTALAVSVVWPLLVPVVRPMLRTGLTVAPPSGTATAADAASVASYAAPDLSLLSRLTADVQTLLAPLHDVALLLWLAVSVTLFARLLLAAWRVHRLTREAAPVMVDGEQVLLAEALGPASVGWRKPQIVLPAWVLALDGSLRALVLRHEREHCRAGDPRHVWTAAIAVALMPWNPAVWWMSRRLRLALELDCDARTLAQGGDPTVYAKLLLFMTQQHAPSAARHHVALSLAGSRSHLSQRIAAMKRSPSVLSGRTRLFIGGAVVLAIGAACSMSIPGEVAMPEGDAMTANSVTTTIPAPAPHEPGTPYFEFQVDEPASMIPGGNRMQYPEMLRSAQVEGTVLLSFVLDENGVPDMSTFKVLRSDHELFTNSVRIALPDIRYQPAKVGGQAVKQLVQQPFVFALGTKPSGPVNAPVAEAPAAPVPGTPYFEFQVDEPASMIPGGNRMQYPAMLRSAQVEGTVLLSFVLDENGVPDMSTIKVLRSDHELFTNSVRTALPDIRYKAAKVGGQAVKQVVQQPFVFSLAR